MFCPSCGTQNENSALYCLKCGTRLPSDGNLGPSQPLPSLPASTSPIYAGFWKRAVAYLLDWIVLYALFFVFALLFGTVLGQDLSGNVYSQPRPWVALQLVVPWLYYALMESSPKQATLGKMALGIRVVDLAGRRISFLRASARFFGQILSSMIFCIGYMMAGFTRRKQALHDMIAGCLVVNRSFAPDDALVVPPRRPMSGAVIALIVIALMIPIAGILAAIAIPAYQDYRVRARLAEVANVGNAATRAVNDFYAAHNNTLPDDIGATGFSDSGRYVDAVTFDGANRMIALTTNFAPIEGKHLLYVASSASDAPRIVWRCTSDDIPERYLPKHCRSTTTRL
jgi:uncharacterized RDD family membrane protein YckC/type II secretory pathway pseudopilin PulG